ncbi:hypothetical protein VTL71DRAFT_16329 [Oculimacula yallundae]|uniref:Nucleotide sugar dehydrogenase n=1 Tax=Oculimacula yallundae TaxID=86028 RepID=A0ABR4CE45_9HELO
MTSFMPTELSFAPQVLPCTYPAFQQYESLKMAAVIATIEVDSESQSEHSDQCHQLDSDPGYESEARFVDTDERVSFESTVAKTVSNIIVAVIGVGYVGLELVQAFAKNYTVIAFDISAERVATLGRQHANLASVTFSSDEGLLGDATHFLVSVPTLLLPNRQVDDKYLRSAISTITRHARPGSTVVMESSVSVGMTRKLMAPFMRSHGLRAGMSPERVDPGRSEPAFETIPKIISGLDDITPGSLESISELYSKVFDHIVPVSSPEVAEMTKLYENCQRMMAIAYANEMADACADHGIDSFEVSRAACTKPFGFLPMMPSLGVGGHCIPVNPHYLLSNSSFPLLEAATEKMRLRPAAVGDRIMLELGKKGELVSSKRRTRVLVVGVAFKRGQSLLTGSPAVSLMQHLLTSWDTHVTFADPFVQESDLAWAPRLNEELQWNKTGLEWFDMIVVAVRQPGLDFSLLSSLEGVKIEYWN